MGKIIGLTFSKETKAEKEKTAVKETKAEKEQTKK